MFQDWLLTFIGPFQGRYSLTLLEILKDLSNQNFYHNFERRVGIRALATQNINPSLLMIRTTGKSNLYCALKTVNKFVRQSLSNSIDLSMNNITNPSLIIHLFTYSRTFYVRAWSDQPNGQQALLSLARKIFKPLEPFEPFNSNILYVFIF